MEASVINDSTFSSANPSSYSLSEIWPNTTTATPTPPPPFDSDADNNSTLTHHHNHNNKRKDSSSTTTTTPNHSSGCSGNKHMKFGGSSDDNGGSLSRAEADANSVSGNKLAQQAKANKPSKSPKQDYIHVRARRGQATDSHSLAERARREKISERMKILQDLVPGCNKVIGKTLVLDEIINYIQSLHRQVEFLSMKLEAVNSRFNMSPTVESFRSKDLGTRPFDLAGMMFGSQATMGYVEGSQPGWLHMQLGGGLERAT